MRALGKSSGKEEGFPTGVWSAGSFEGNPTILHRTVNTSFPEQEARDSEGIGQNRIPVPQFHRLYYYYICSYRKKELELTSSLLWKGHGNNPGSAEDP